MSLSWERQDESSEPSDTEAQLKTFFFCTLSVCCLVIGLSLGINGLQTRYPTAASLTWCALVDRKLEAARAAGEGKILLVGGSGVSLGLNAQQIEADINKPVANFGLQAALGPKIMLHEAKRVLNPGDTAVLIFEYPLLYGKNAINSVSREWFLGCGQEQLASMGLIERLRFYLSIDPMRGLQHVGQADQAFQEAQDQMQRRFTGKGDRNLEPSTWAPLSAQKQERLRYYQPETIALDDEAPGPLDIRAFSDWAEQHGVRVLASWPNTIFFAAYQDNPHFASIRTFFESLNIPVIGEPAMAMLDISLFHDTQYHLKPEGIRRRTAAFSAALREVMAIDATSEDGVE